MGTTMFFAMLSSMPEYNDKVKAMFALAPVAYMTHVKSPIKLLAPFSNNLQVMARFLGIGKFLPRNWVVNLLARYGCEIVEAEKIICENIIFTICGFDRQQFNEVRSDFLLHARHSSTLFRLYFQ